MTYAPGPAAIVFAHVCFTLIYGSYQRPPARKNVVLSYGIDIHANAAEACGGNLR